MHVKNIIITIIIVGMFGLIGAVLYNYYVVDKKYSKDYYDYSIKNDYLKYSDELMYSFRELVPTTKDNVISSINNNICKKEKDVICAMYTFNITNNDINQEKLSYNLIPIVNDYDNLNYILYDKNKKNILKEGKISTDTITLDEITKTFKSNQEITYNIIFYLEANGTSNENKYFTSIIEVNTNLGYYISSNIGELCWNVEQMDNKNSYKIVAFNGLYENETPKEECSIYFNNDYDKNKLYRYIVNIPNNIGSVKITTVSDKLFYPYSQAKLGGTTSSKLLMIR